jgi:hypothetical protein
MEKKFSRSGFVRSQVVPALLMFAIPLLGHWFAQHAQRTFDARFLDSLSAALKDASDLTPEKRTAIQTFYRENPASTLCAREETRSMLPPEYANEACGTTRSSAGSSKLRSAAPRTRAARGQASG